MAQYYCFPYHKESLFDLMTSLEHINFHIIGYLTSSIWSLCHILLEETCCCHKGNSFDKQQGNLYMHFQKTGQHLPKPLMDQLWSTGWNGK